MATTISYPSKKQVLDNYVNHLSGTGSSKNQYIGWAKSFLDYSEGRYDRRTVDGFLQKLRNSNDYGEGSVNHVFQVIRTLFSRSQIEWPFNRGDAPLISENDVNAPALDPRTVRRCIEATIMSDNIPAAVMLALSTTYGLRRQEMCNLTAEDIRYKDKTIYISTLKHGRQRTHVIPDAIIGYLKLYDFDTPRSTSWMWQTWFQLERLISLRHIDRVGFHAIRRTLDTLLLQQFPETTVASFLRWKQATSSNMPYRYSKTKFVGEEESVTILGGESLTTDQQIFAKDENGVYKHPFLGSWL
jgi:integrase